MKKINIIVALTALFSLFSCIKEDVEDPSKGPRIFGFTKPSDSYIYTDLDKNDVTNPIAISLIGGANGTPETTDVAIKYKIASGTTATENTHFSFTNTTKTLIIPAGRDFAQIPMVVKPQNLPANKPLEVILELENANPGTIAAIHQSITITIAKCESKLEGNYSVKVTRIDNNVVTNYPNEVIKKISQARYETASTGPYGSNLVPNGAARNGFIFNDVCQSINVEKQNLGDYYSNMVYGEDKEENKVYLDPVSGNVTKIVMTYYIDGFSTGVAKRKFKAEYTKL